MVDTDPRLKPIGRHELLPDTRDGAGVGDTEPRGIPSYAGARAGMLLDGGGVTIFDTQGIETFRLEMPACAGCGRKAGEVRGGAPCCPAAEKMRRDIVRWEMMHCSDCGTRVWEGAMFCRECRPYGFWHWLRYFSPVAWRRVRADRRKIGKDGSKKKGRDGQAVL